MNQLVLTLGCGAVAGAGGAAVPWMLRSLPQPTTAEQAGSLPAGEEPPPTYAVVAGRPHLGALAAALSAAAAVLLALALGPDPALVGLVALVPVCVALGVVDLHTRLLPRVVVLPATLALLLLVVATALLEGDPDTLVRAVLGLAVARSAYWVLWFVRSAGLGFGDVRLAALVGLALGQLGWPELVVGLYAGFLVFAVPGVLWALVRRDRAVLSTAYPFGPFLLLGALLGVLAGAPVVRALGW